MQTCCNHWQSRSTQVILQNDLRNPRFGCNSRDSQSGFPTDLDGLYRVSWKLRDRLHISLGSGVVGASV